MSAKSKIRAPHCAQVMELFHVVDHREDLIPKV